MKIILDLVGSAILMIAGGCIVTFRGKVVSAMLTSNKVFWENIGFNVNDKGNLTIAKFIIPAIGLIFLLSGLIGVCRILFSK